MARRGLPLLTHIYLGADDLREQFNHSQPSDDDSLFISNTISTVSKYTALAATTILGHTSAVWGLFGTLTLPYQLGIVASFDYTGFNGRSLREDVMDNMLC